MVSLRSIIFNPFNPLFFKDIKIFYDKILPIRNFDLYMYVILSR